MKQVLIAGLACLAGVIVTFWLVSEPVVQQSSDVEAPSQPLVAEQVLPSIELDSGSLTEITVSTDPESSADTQVNGSNDLTVSAIVDAVPILPGIELSGDMAMFHVMLEEEVRDESWALSMETELYNYFFASSQELANNFGVPNVVCRTTVCEIQAIGYGDGSLEVWQTATSDLDSQPWADDIIQMRLGGNPIEPDSEGLVLVIIRASGDSTIQALSEAVAAI